MAISSQQVAFQQTRNYKLSLPAMKILMVCLGNICRSPLAEGILHHKVQQEGLSWIIDSAGTNGYHVGEAPHRLSQKVALLNGIDISHQRSRRFTAADFREYDKIYAMAEDVIEEMQRIARKDFEATKVDLLMNELHPGRNMDVPDPWYGTEPGYHEVFAMINQACDKIVEKYRILNDEFPTSK
jgi:protein-tyrosine phosphatase